jgi:protocatechuate 3,4-dioxygenase beta subunit
MIGRHLKTLVLVLLTAVAPITLNAQQQTNDDNSDDRSTRSLTGKVVNENGQPVPNATVMIRALNGGQSRVTITSSEGTFSVDGLDPTLYYVSASFPAYTMRRDPLVPFSPYRPGDSVKLDLIKGGVITGTVTSSTGEPVIGIRVRAYLIRDGEGRKPTTAAFSGERTTDDRGIYRMYGLAPGTYLVASAGVGVGFSGGAYDADVPTFAPSSTRDTASEFVVRSGEETTNVDIRHRGEMGHEVSGTATGSVMPGPYVQFTITLAPVVPGMPPATTFQSGSMRGFSFAGVPDGTYDVMAQSSTGIEATVSDQKRITVKGADVTGIELITKPLGSISGRLLLEPSQEPECKGKRNLVLSETMITPLRNDEKTNEQSPFMIRYLIGPTVPDNDGAFTFRNVAPNRYGFAVKLYAKYWYLQSITFPSASGAATADKSSRVIDVARNWLNIKQGERISNLSITLAGGAASLRGSLETEAAEKTPPRLYLNLVPAEREKSEDVLRFFATPINEDGSFTLGNLPPGRYRPLLQTIAENETQWQAKIRRPEESEVRAKLRREAEISKTEIELKPCQNVVSYKLPLNLK